MWLERMNRGTYRSRVDSNAIILIVHIRSSNDHIATRPNIESIRILAQTVSRRVINRHARNGQAIHPVDGNSLDGRVLDVQVRNRRVGQVVRIKELGLGHAAAAAFAIPPARAVRVEVRPRGARDGDARAFDLQEGAVPFGVAPGCLAFEDDLSSDVTFCQYGALDKMT